MAWVLVPPLHAARVQMNKRFPNRDKTTDGVKGNEEHAARVSSHNPDLTGKPEHRDGDSKDEVRAIDIDKDLRDPHVVMEDVVQLWVKLCRAGVLWWVRYIIFNGRIWHKRDGYVTRVYTGSNKHTGHVHMTSDFSQKADEASDVNYHLDSLTGKPTAPKPPTKPALLEVDGQLGPKTIARWQQVMGTPVDGKIDAKKSALIMAVQRRLLSVDHRIKVDGEFGPKTIGALQRYLKTPVDGFISKPESEMVKALQRRLNKNQF